MGMLLRIFQSLITFLITFFASYSVLCANVTVKQTVNNVNNKQEVTDKLRKEKKIELKTEKSSLTQKDDYTQDLKETGGFHIVKDGETLFGIARTYSVPYSVILKENIINENGSIKIGQKIKIPQTNVGVKNLALPEVNKYETKPIPSNGLHMVTYGETLFGIARTYGVSPIDVAAENEFDLSHLVKVGDKLKIPNKDGNNALKIEKKEEILVQKNDKQISKNNDKPVISKKSEKKCEFHFLWPLQSKKILKQYGEILKNGIKNDGIVIESVVDSKVLASYDGEVVYVGNDIPEYGNLMMIKHKDNWITIYGYLKSSYKKNGDKVSKGDEIAKTGETGDAVSPSMYFSIRKVKTPYNPELCI